jgi:hypothetical protein
MIQNSCPHCGSINIEDTDQGTVTPDEVQQEFQCVHCATTWDVVYSPIEIKNVRVAVEINE